MFLSTRTPLRRVLCTCSWVVLASLGCPLAVVGQDDTMPDADEAAFVADYGTDRVMTGDLPDTEKQYQGVVKVEVATLTPDYSMPWQPGNYSGGIGTAFLIGKCAFLTNAHVVSNAERIHISQYGSSRKIPAKVKYVAHDADLALIEIDEKDFAPFAELPYFELSQELPKLEDEVRALGYPIGGTRLSVTRGVVSRIDFITYAHSKMQKHLAIQIDAAINPGNSGGPVLMGNKVIGVAFQGIASANNTGYVIPVPVVNRFLQDVRDGRYDQYVDLGVTLFPISNPALRKALQLPDDERGVLASDIVKGSSCDGLLKTGDVILKVDDYDVDSSGMINLDGESISMNELIERRFAGDIVAIDIMRQGKPERVSVQLKTSQTGWALEAEYDRKPRYVICAGLVFQPMQRDVLNDNKIPFHSVSLEVTEFLQGVNSPECKERVMLTSVLDDAVNSQLPPQGSYPPVVSKVNGVRVQSLAHLNELLYPQQADQQTPFIVIEMEGDKYGRPIVLKRADIAAANARIARQYNIGRAVCLDGSRETITPTAASQR